MDNTSASIVTFILITFFYSIIRFVLAGTTSEKIFTVIYFILIISIQYTVNISNLSKRCGNVSYGTAMYVTLIPWLFIFGLLYVCLIIFPGWKSPFSNTFGYAVASIAGVKSLLTDSILEDPNALKKRGVKDLLDVRQDIYNDPGLMINEITPDNYDLFWEKMSPIFREGAEDYKESLRQLIFLKDVVSEFIWYLLVGSFTISVSFNNISNVECKKSAKDMEAEEQENELKLNKSEPETQQKVYVDTD